MFLSILKQLWNRKRKNSWLLIELLLVFCFIWYIVDFFFVLGFNFSVHNYRDLNHAWEIKIEELPEEHPEYNTEDAQPENRLANFRRILEQVRNHPMVESVGISFSGSSPGKGSYSNKQLINPENEENAPWGQVVRIEPHEDFFRVFRHTSDKGRREIRMSDFDWVAYPNGLVINELMASTLFPGTSAVGRIVGIKNYGDDSIQEHRILGVIDDTKRFDSGLPQRVIYQPTSLSGENVLHSELIVRANSDLTDEKFKSSFQQEMTSRIRIGNYYLQKVTSYNTIHANTERLFGLNAQIMTRTALMFFFMVNIILCLLGTFWYRVNLRREEIGLRLAIGSTTSGIKSLFLLESFCLLLIIVIPAMLIEFQFVRLDMLSHIGEGQGTGNYIIQKPFLRFLITNALTVLLMMIILTVSVWLPAKKAASLEPAEALHYE